MEAMYALMAEFFIFNGYIFHRMKTISSNNKTAATQIQTQKPHTEWTKGLNTASMAFQLNLKIILKTSTNWENKPSACSSWIEWGQILNEDFMEIATWLENHDRSQAPSGPFGHLLECLEIIQISSYAIEIETFAASEAPVFWDPGFLIISINSSRLRAETDSCKKIWLWTTYLLRSLHKGFEEIMFIAQP